MLYTIKNNYLEVQLSDNGAEIKSIKYLGKDYLHNSDPKYWGRSAPLLWPNIGTIKNGTASINGINYPMKKHGFLRDTLCVVDHVENNKIVFKVESNVDTLKLYPYEFKILITYELIEKSIHSYLEFFNYSINKMPFNLGLHPAFKVPLYSDKFEDYHLEFSNKKTYHTPSVDLTTGTIDFNKVFRTFENLSRLDLNYQDYDFDAIVLNDINFDNILLKKQDKTLLSFTFNGFNSLGIWTPNNNVFANFICLEPWHGCADASDHDGIYEHKKDIINLNVGDSKLFTYSFEFYK